MTYGKRGVLIRLAYLVMAIVFFALNKIRIGRPCHAQIILCYHGITPNQRPNFLKQLKSVKNKVVASKNIGMDTEHTQVCLTFDDAFANLLSNVIPATTEYHIPITIFIPTGSLGVYPSWLQGTEHADSHETIMSIEQLLSLKTNPFISFGSHTVDHPRLSSLSAEKIREQVRRSRESISNLIHENITELALPHGDYNDVVIQIALEEGYQKIYTLDPIVYDTVSSVESPLIGRFSASPDDWPVEFYLTVNGAYAWLAAWRGFLRRIRMARVI